MKVQSIIYHQKKLLCLKENGKQYLFTAQFKKKILGHIKTDDFYKVKVGHLHITSKLMKKDTVRALNKLFNSRHMNIFLHAETCSLIEKSDADKLVEYFENAPHNIQDTILPSHLSQKAGKVKFLKLDEGALFSPCGSPFGSDSDWISETGIASSSATESADEEFLTNEVVDVEHYNAQSKHSQEQDLPVNNLDSLRDASCKGDGTDIQVGTGFKVHVVEEINKDKQGTDDCPGIRNNCLPQNPKKYFNRYLATRKSNPEMSIQKRQSDSCGDDPCPMPPPKRKKSIPLMDNDEYTSCIVNGKLILKRCSDKGITGIEPWPPFSLSLPVNRAKKNTSDDTGLLNLATEMDSMDSTAVMDHGNKRRKQQEESIHLKKACKELPMSDGDLRTRPYPKPIEPSHKMKRSRLQSDPEINHRLSKTLAAAENSDKSGCKSVSMFSSKSHASALPRVLDANSINYAGVHVCLSSPQLRSQMSLSVQQDEMSSSLDDTLPYPFKEGPTTDPIVRRSTSEELPSKAETFSKSYSREDLAQYGVAGSHSQTVDRIQTVDELRDAISVPEMNKVGCLSVNHPFAPIDRQPHPRTRAFFHAYEPGNEKRHTKSASLPPSFQSSDRKISSIVGSVPHSYAQNYEQQHPKLSNFPHTVVSDVPCTIPPGVRQPPPMLSRFTSRFVPPDRVPYPELRSAHPNFTPVNRRPHPRLGCPPPAVVPTIEEPLKQGSGCHPHASMNGNVQPRLTLGSHPTGFVPSDRQSDPKSSIHPTFIQDERQTFPVVNSSFPSTFVRSYAQSRHLIGNIPPCHIPNERGSSPTLGNHPHTYVPGDQQICTWLTSTFPQTSMACEGQPQSTLNTLLPKSVPNKRQSPSTFGKENISTVNLKERHPFEASENIPSSFKSGSEQATYCNTSGAAARQPPPYLTTPSSSTERSNHIAWGPVVPTQMPQALKPPYLMGPPSIFVPCSGSFRLPVAHPLMPPSATSKRESRSYNPTFHSMANRPPLPQPLKLKAVPPPEFTTPVPYSLGPFGTTPYWLPPTYPGPRQLIQQRPTKPANYHDAGHIRYNIPRFLGEHRSMEMLPVCDINQGSTSLTAPSSKWEDINMAVKKQGQTGEVNLSPNTMHTIKGIDNRAVSMDAFIDSNPVSSAMQDASSVALHTMVNAKEGVSRRTSRFKSKAHPHCVSTTMNQQTVSEDDVLSNMKERKFSPELDHDFLIKDFIMNFRDVDLENGGHPHPEIMRENKENGASQGPQLEHTLCGLEEDSFLKPDQKEDALLSDPMADTEVVEIVPRKSTTQTLTVSSTCITPKGSGFQTVDGNFGDSTSQTKLDVEASSHQSSQSDFCIKSTSEIETSVPPAEGLNMETCPYVPEYPAADVRGQVVVSRATVESTLSENIEMNICRNEPLCNSDPVVPSECDKEQDSREREEDTLSTEDDDESILSLLFKSQAFFKEAMKKMTFKCNTVEGKIKELQSELCNTRTEREELERELASLERC